ncbi:MAG: SDR family oxidoreductase [Chloroflexi bacterium]|nr:SDR family oxidoreductase [Chloroflexota bacterium]
MGRLDDKVAVITGGSGEIGLAAARQFVDEGAKVMLVDIDEDALKSAAEDIGENAAYHVADVSDPEETEAYIKATVDQFGGLDILLANAGIEGETGTIAETPIENFDKVISVNVRGVWLSIRYAMPEMQKRGGGSIVISSSVAGVTGTAGLSPYVTSKHAVIGTMRCAALEGAPHNIRCNTINPGPVESRMMDSLETQFAGGDAEAASQVKEGFEQQVPLGRYAYPEEVADLMLFLASDESKYITGTTNLIEGGFTIS